MGDRTMGIAMDRIAAWNRGHDAGYDAQNYAEAYGEIIVWSDITRRASEVYPDSHDLSAEYAAGFLAGIDEYKERQASEDAEY